MWQFGLVCVGVRVTEERSCAFDKHIKNVFQEPRRNGASFSSLRIRSTGTYRVLHPLEEYVTDLAIYNIGFSAVFSSRVGTAVAQWLRCCATIQKVAGSIPAGVSGFFIDVKSFRSHYGPGVDSASNRNEYQEYFLGVKAAGV